LRFPADLRGLPEAALARTAYVVRAHPLMSLPPLQSACPHRARSQPVGFERLPWVLALLRDTSTASLLRDRHPKSTYGPPTAFLTLPTDYSCPHLASLFHLAATSKVPSSGALARQPADLCSSQSRALSPLAIVPYVTRKQRARFDHLVLRALIQLPIRCYRQVV